MSAERKTYGQELREKGISIAHVPGGSRPRSGPAKKEPGYWEKTKATETRPGGGVVPLLNKDLKPLNLKHYAQDRQKYEAIKRDRHNQRGD